MILETLRLGVARLDDSTKDAQSTVQHQAWAGQDGYGADVTPTTVSRECFIFNTTQKVRGPDGQLKAARHRLLFIGNVTVDIRDTITLPSPLVSGPLLSVDGVSQPGTGVLFTVVLMG